MRSDSRTVQTGSPFKGQFVCPITCSWLSPQIPSPSANQARLLFLPLYPVHKANSARSLSHQDLITS